MDALRRRFGGKGKDPAPANAEANAELATQKPKIEQGNKPQLKGRPKPPLESAKPSVAKKPKQSLVEWTKRFYANVPQPVTTKTEVVDAYDAMYNHFADKQEKYFLIAAMQQRLSMQLEALDYFSRKRSVVGQQRGEKQMEDKERMECQCQVPLLESEEPITTAGAMARPKQAMSPEHKEKDEPSASVKSSSDLQGGEMGNEAKINRQHQAEKKALKEDQVSMADTAGKAEPKGRIAPRAQAKEKDLKRASVKSSSDLQGGEMGSEAKINRQHQAEKKALKEDQVSMADTAGKAEPKGRIAPRAQAKEKDLKRASVKSSSDLQGGEMGSEAKINRQHQAEKKALKQDQVDMADTAGKAEAKGRIAPRAQAKEKDLKRARGVAEKFDRSEMSGNIQNTAARDKLNREVQTYFKDTLWALADGDDPSKLEKLVKALIVMCEEGAKKIAEVVDHFSVEFQKDQDVLDTLSCITQLDSQADKKGLFQLVVAIHSPPFYMDREGKKLSASEWQLFQKIIFLKSLTLRISEPQESIKAFMHQLAEKELQPLLQRPRRYSSSDIHEKFVNTSVNILVDMLLSPNPIVPSISLDRFDTKYVTMDLWDFEEFKDAAGIRKADGQRIAAFKRPILLTCTYQTVKVEPGYVRLDLTAFSKP